MTDADWRPVANDELAVSEAEARELFAATDKLATAAMRLVAHMTYARRVDMSGAPLQPDDFKADP